VAENAGWRYKILPDVKNARMAELQPDFDDASWDTVDTQANAESLSQPAQAVYRTKLAITEDDLKSEGAQLKIGRIDDRGWIYVNGKLAGESRDWSASPTFDIKSLLHAGENSIAIAVVNSDGSGGLGNNIVLRLLKQVETPQWQRSAFNGLAQVIVQSGTEAGEIKLTATGDGLTPATVAIQTKK
jgi:hypothetical protein